MTRLWTLHDIASVERAFGTPKFRLGQEVLGPEIRVVDQLVDDGLVTGCLSIIRLWSDGLATACFSRR